MSEIMLFALLGLGSGALIAGIALGLVLNYRGAGVTNLAIGAVAMFGAYEYYSLRALGDFFLPVPGVPLLGIGRPWGALPSFLVALAMCALMGTLFDALVLSRLRSASPLAKLVASLGLMLTLQALALEEFGNGGQSAPAVLPAGPSDVVRVFGGVVPLDRFLLTGIVVVATVALGALYRYSRFGLATRAAAENETVAVLTGLAPQRISLVNTVMAFSLAGSLGILVAPTSQLDSVTIPFAVIPALGAALLARLTSFWVAAAAGLGMGIIESELVYLQTKTWFPTSGGIPLPGVSDLLFFVLIMLVVLWRGRSLPTRGTIGEARLPAAPRPKRVALPTAVAVAVCCLLLVFTSPNVREAVTNTLIGLLVCLSLVVITGFAGQISLFQVGLAGIAGLTVSKLAVNAGLGFPLGPLIGVVLATFIGVVVGLPALRVRGVNLAILTVAGMVAIENFGLENTTWGAGTGGGSPVPAPKLFGLDLGPDGGFPWWHGGVPTPTFGLFCLATVVVFGLVVVGVRRSILGQQMLAVRSNERAAAAAGISASKVKVAAIALSSLVGAVAGVLYAYDFASVTPDQFGPTVALEFVAFAYLGGITTVRGATLGSLLAPGALGALAMNELGISSDYLLVIGGLGLIIAVTFAPDGAAITPLREQPPIVFLRWASRLMMPRFELRYRQGMEGVAARELAARELAARELAARELAARELAAREVLE